MKGNLIAPILSKYINPVFVETGTYEGHTVKLAIDLKFEEIYSIEIKESLYKDCKNNFAKHKNVHLYLGDSAECLWDVIKDIDKTITFWLDGHDIGRIPILKELEIISRHPIKEHTILVDDRRVMGTDIWSGISENDVVTAMLKINPNYSILYEDSLNANEDIIVATLLGYE